PDADAVVLVTRDGYIKRQPLDQYRRQRRGGRGLSQIETKEEDLVIRTFVSRTHDHLLFFTNQGRVYLLKTYELPEGSRHTKGKAIINLLPKLKEGEKVRTLLSVRDLEQDGSLLFATRHGLVKRTRLDRFQNIRTSGIQAILLEEGDELVDVALVGDDRTEVVLATHAGQAVRFPLSEVRPTGRATFGVSRDPTLRGARRRRRRARPRERPVPGPPRPSPPRATGSGARPTTTARPGGARRGSGRSGPADGTARSSRSFRRPTIPRSSSRPSGGSRSAWRSRESVRRPATPSAYGSSSWTTTTWSATRSLLRA
ncbi:DNA gyrase subunit A, partial [mine drainage metagenome]